MNSKIDTKQKVTYLQNYLKELKTQQDSQRFITLVPNQCGFFDFDFVTRRRITIGDIEKNLKDNKYSTVKEMFGDIKHIYLSISDYLLLDDPLQPHIKKLLQALELYENKFMEEFRENRASRPESKVAAQVRKQDPKSKQKEKEDTNKDNSKQRQQQPVYEFNRKSTFAQRLEMFFYLRSHEDNAEYIKSIGDGYGIGCEQPDQEGYTIRLETNASTCPWLELLQKKDQ